MAEIIGGRLSHAEGARKLGVSRKTVSRSLKRYRAAGESGLVHRRRGKVSGRAIERSVKAKVLALYQLKYEGFGPTLAAEKLCEEDRISVHAETLRLWLKAAGLWQSCRHRRRHRIRRARKARFGEMLQLDGSIHAWFSDSSEKQCLMNLVDDATGKTLSLMDYGETTRCAFALLKWWVREAGIPMSIYVDLKSLYVSPKSLKEKALAGEELIEPSWLTHFSSSCKKLGIAVIKAYSAQAKGRVERSHAVYQDRFVKELKLKGVTDIAGANALLSGGFINRLNEKFAKPALSDEDAHVPVTPDNDLETIFCWAYERQVSHDWVVRFENTYYQLENTSQVRVQPKQKIQVLRHLDESLSFWCQGVKLPVTPLCEKPVKTAARRRARRPSERAEIARQNKHKTPWGRFNPDWLPTTKQPGCVAS